jgi:hypothetical protein
MDVGDILGGFKMHLFILGSDLPYDRPHSLQMEAEAFGAMSF